MPLDIPPTGELQSTIEDDSKVQELLEKDAKSARTPSGFWHWLVAGLGAGMVLFYFYTAGVTSVATQYHRGVYVFITYVLVFLLYPTSTRLRWPLALFSGFLAAGVLIWWATTDAAPDWLPNTMPYATVLLVLIFMSQRLRMPAADGQIYPRGG